MANMVRSCLQFLLKLVNLVMGIVGVSMILYGLWMIRVWQRDSVDIKPTSPWFIYTFLGIGIGFVLTTWTGHIAADTENGHCLSCYTTIILFILLLETAVTADILLNSEWEKDLPKDPTGKFDDFKDFVKLNFDIFQWIGFIIVLSQGLSLLLAMVLKTLGIQKGANYDSDDDYASARFPLLNNRGAQPLPYAVRDGPFAPKNNACNGNIMRM